MFNHEQAHNQLLEKIASLERMLAALLTDEPADDVAVIYKSESPRRKAALQRLDHYAALRTKREGLRQ